MKQKIFKTVIISVLLTLFSFGPVLADNVIKCPPGVQVDSPLCSAIREEDHDPKEKIISFMTAAIPWVLLVSVLMIIYAGYNYASSAGNPEKVKLAKDIIKYTIVGLIVIFLAGTIVGFFVNILN